MSETTGGPEPWPNPQSWQKEQSQPASPGPAFPRPPHPGVARAQLQRGGPHPHIPPTHSKTEENCGWRTLALPLAAEDTNGDWMEKRGRVEHIPSLFFLLCKMYDIYRKVCNMHKCSVNNNKRLCTQPQVSNPSTLEACMPGLDPFFPEEPPSSI